MKGEKVLGNILRLNTKVCTQLEVKIGRETLVILEDVTEHTLHHSTLVTAGVVAAGWSRDWLKNLYKI